MKLWSRLIFAAAGMASVGLFGTMLMTGRAKAQATAPTPTKGKTAGETFKNVTTNALKGLSPDDFLAAMGVMADDLGLDCADCHPGAGTDKVDWVIDTPPKRTARRMVDMMQSINMANFGGAQRVTCWTCHHGRETPASTIALDNLYSTPNGERDDILQAPTPAGQTATQILDKYIAAVGGAQKLAGLTSWIATGASVGYEGLGGNGDFTIYAQAPNKRTTQIQFRDHPERGDSTWTFDGTTGWIKTPRGLLGEFEVAGSGLQGTRLEAMMSFPGQIKTVLTNWRVGAMESMGTRDFNVLQGSGPQGLLATLYFDTETNLLVRIIRYTASPVGRVPTQVDYADYRDVGGIKFPFEYNFQWLDGRYTAKINDVKTNVAIPASKFGKP